jgi:surface polysaccharide O-acyltransferase-like enzyme
MRLIWADILKILAIFGVILLHVSAPFVVPFEPTRQWWIGNIYDSLTRWCVPLFVMVSGALVLGRADGTPFTPFFFVRMRRILIPFIFWSGVYFLYRLLIKQDTLGPADFVRMLLTEPIYYHLWFVYMLIVLYLLAPPAGAFLNHVPSRHAWYLAAVWFFWTSLLPILDKPLPFETYYTPDMNDYSALRLSGYFLLGYMLRDHVLRSGSHWALALAAFMGGAAATILGTYWLSLGQGEFHPFFYKYFSVTVVAMTLPLFLFVKSVFPRPSPVTFSEQGRRNAPAWPRWLHHAGTSVFGVYLLHALVLELLRDGRWALSSTTPAHSAFSWPPSWACRCSPLSSSFFRSYRFSWCGGFRFSGISSHDA